MSVSPDYVRFCLDSVVSHRHNMLPRMVCPDSRQETAWCQSESHKAGFGVWGPQTTIGRVVQSAVGTGRDLMVMWSVSRE